MHSALKAKFEPLQVQEFKQERRKKNSPKTRRQNDARNARNASDLVLAAMQGMGKVLTKGRDVCCEVNAGGSLYGRIWVGKFVWEKRGERAFLLWAQGGRVIVSARDQTVRAQKVEERGRHSPVPPSSPQVVGP